MSPASRTSDGALISSATLRPAAVLGQALDRQPEVVHLGQRRVARAAGAAARAGTQPDTSGKPVHRDPSRLDGATKPASPGPGSGRWRAKDQALRRFFEHLQDAIELPRVCRQIAADFIEAWNQGADAARRRLAEQRSSLSLTSLQANHQPTRFDQQRHRLGRRLLGTHQGGIEQAQILRCQQLAQLTCDLVGVAGRRFQVGQGSGQMLPVLASSTWLALARKSRAWRRVAPPASDNSSISDDCIAMRGGRHRRQLAAASDRHRCLRAGCGRCR